ncbi:MAG: OmpA family protein [Alphaproteobacteria bacterium]
MKKILLSTAALTFVLSGCVATDPYTGQTTLTNTGGGSAIGAALGGFVGAVTAEEGDRGRGALRGALAGGVVGAGVGAYMDYQERELRQSLEGTGVGIERQGDDLRLIMPSEVTFDVASFEIKPSFYAVLDNVADVMINYPETTVQIAGHTDSDGSDSYNQDLSVQRASAVRNFLSAQGVEFNRMSAVGFGERFPIASNDTEYGKAQNRRVEITLSPASDF